MQDTYAIYTGNRFNQVLLFDSFEAAAVWCRSATRWTETEIKENIKKAVQLGTPYSTIAEV